jgi:drug/metabolite transporter (DMT)-like permease
MTKNLSSKIKQYPSYYQGLFWIFVDVSSLTVVYIATKLFLNSLPFPVFGIYWFGTGFLWNLLFLLFTPEAKQSLKNAMKFSWFLFFVGFLDAVATIMWFKAIEETPNPSVVSFMTNISPIYALLFGMLIHKERFTLMESLGMLITFVGVVMVSYAPSLTFHNFLFQNAGIILFSSLLSQLSTAILKFKVSSIHPVVFALNRLIFLLTFVIALLFMNPSSYSLHLPVYNIFLISVASFFGPFLSTIAGYKALSNLKMGTYSFLLSSRSFFVLLASYIVLHNFPRIHQVVGGLTSIVGITLLSFKESWQRSKQQTKE